MNIIKITDEYVLLAGITNLEIDDVKTFMNKFRSVNKDVVVQIVNSDFIAGMQHIIGVLYQSVEAKKRGILLSKSREVDILLRLACTDQIKKAFTKIGIRDGMNNVLVIAIGKLNYLKLLRKYIVENYDIDNNVLNPSKRRLKSISSFHSVGKAELNTLVNDTNKLASILTERASLL